MSNPFKPGQPIDPAFFGGRKSELDIFSEYLGHTISDNPHHLAVMGERGIGKSSLLRKYEQVARDQGCIVARRELDTSIDSIEALVILMLRLLKTDAYSSLSTKTKARNKIKEFFDSYKIDLSILGTGLSIEKRLEKSVALQDSFYNELIRIWNSVKEKGGGDVPAIVYLLDETEQLQNIHGAWSFLRSVFTRVAEHGGNYMIVVSGKLSLFKGIKEIFSPIERFLTPIEVKPMALDETREALEKPLNSFSRRIDEEGVGIIHRMSSGHPYVVQAFGFYAFETGERSVTKDTVQRILPRVMTRLSAQLFKERFDSATRTERRVLLAMSEIATTTTATGRSISPKEVATQSGLSEKTVPEILNRLTRKDCVVKVERGWYVLFNPLFGDYVRGAVEREGLPE